MAEDPKTPDDGVYGTMQLPRGAVLIEERPPPATSVPPPASAIDVTIRPTADAAMPSVAPPALPAPDTRYQLGEEIARGGMGRVVDATDTVLGRTVAFKEALSNDPDALRRFERETRITARLEHPSIVPVHDAGTSANGQPFYVMRKIGGRPLEKLVGEANTLPQRLALIPHIIASAHAIAHAHERGIVHRDIKPSNILAGDLGETIVIDWGLAKVIGEADDLASADALASVGADPLQTRAGVVFGTPGFMSPEQLRGAPVDEQCDVYALGATLYHLLARRPPHHARTADEMMRAAVTAPPTPVGELVDGVPPELETIVAKALAQTAAARYPSSRALAEDLQRFLTGQLVAAHRYSRRERFWRFVKQHRVELGIGAAALALIIVLSTGFILRILAERDRADAEAREAQREKRVADEQRIAATERADQLVLGQARVLVGSNPTAAVALLGPLARSPRWWPQVRAIGAAARAAGIASVLPASPRTASLELAHDGTHLLATGADGVVRVHDLAAGTTRVVAEMHHAALARLTGDDRHVVIAAGNHLMIADAAGGPPRELDAAARISSLAVAGNTAFWVDLEEAGWTLDVATAGAAPVRLASPEPLRAITPSPDGSWLAIAGATHLFVADRSDPDGKLVPMTEAAVRTIAWAADGSMFAALLPTDVLVVGLGSPPRIIHRLEVGERAAVTLVGTNPFVVGPTGVSIATRDGLIARKQLAGYALGIHAAWHGTVIAGSAQGTIAVLSDAGDPVLAAPSGGLTGFAASPYSPYVVGASDGAVLVWNLSDVLPRALTPSEPAAADLIDDDHVLAAYAHQPAAWLDLRKDTTVDAGELTGVSVIAAAPDGAHAAVLDLAHQLRIVTPGQEARAVAGEVSRVAFLADGRLVIAAPGSVRVRELASARDTTLATRPGEVAALATAGTWIGAAYADGTLWRHDVAAGTDALGPTASDDGGARAVAIAGDGTLVFAAASELRAWHADGTIVTVARLPRPAREIHLVGTGAPPTRALVLADTVAYAIDLAGARVVATIPVAGATAVAPATGLIVVRTSAGVLEVVDAFAGPADGVRWTLANAPDVVFGVPHISSDGHRVLAGTPTGLVVWTLDLPATADATAAWLAHMTHTPAEPAAAAPSGH